MITTCLCNWLVFSTIPPLYFLNGLWKSFFFVNMIHSKYSFYVTSGQRKLTKIFWRSCLSGHDTKTSWRAMVCARTEAKTYRVIQHDPKYLTCLEATSKAAWSTRRPCCARFEAQEGRAVLAQHNTSLISTRAAWASSYMDRIQSGFHWTRWYTTCCCINFIALTRDQNNKIM